MEQSTSYLAQPLEICGKKIKNRIVVPPMADFGMTEQDGLVNNRHKGKKLLVRDILN